MKKFMVMFATLIMSFAFAISVMAAPSPDDEYYDDNPGQDQVDDNTKFDDDEFYKDGDDESSSSTTTSESSSSTTTSESVSPKTGDQGAPASLVYIALAAAAMSVYAAKRLKEQY